MATVWDGDTGEDRRSAIQRMWAYARVTENGAQFGRDVGVGQSSVSRFWRGGGKRLSDNMREAIEAYWVAHGMDEDDVLRELTSGALPSDVNASDVDASDDHDDDNDDDSVGRDTPLSGGNGYEAAAPELEGEVELDAGDAGDAGAPDVEAVEASEGGIAPDAPDVVSPDASVVPDVEGNDTEADGDEADGGIADRGEVEHREPPIPPIGITGEPDGDGGADDGSTDDVDALAPDTPDVDTPYAPKVPDVDGADDGDVHAPDDAPEHDDVDDDADAPDADSDEDLARDDMPDTPPDTDHLLAGQAPEAEDEADEDAQIADAPIMALLPSDAASSAREALVNGWRWHRDEAPAGCYGDTLFWLYTRGDVSFADGGARTVALAPDLHEFECGLTAAELRFGVHPRRRQKHYAVERHKDRGLLIGERLAAVIPEVPYPDEDWFFGSLGLETLDGEWLPPASELVARRRLLTEMLDAFEDNQDAVETRPYPLYIKVALREVEKDLLGVDYAMTFGEQVSGQRTWAPSTRLGIETDWRITDGEEATRILRGAAFAITVHVTTAPLRGVCRSLRGVVRGVARLWLRRRGLWENIFDHPMRRAAAVCRSGSVPSRRAVKGYRLLCSLAGVSELHGQMTGSGSWQAAHPPWSEAYQMKTRPQHHTDAATLRWLPHEFDEASRPLPAADRERRWSDIQANIAKMRRREERKARMRRPFRKLWELALRSAGRFKHSTSGMLSRRRDMESTTGGAAESGGQ